jgi:hypothetical protein
VRPGPCSAVVAVEVVPSPLDVHGAAATSGRTVMTSAAGGRRGRGDGDSSRDASRTGGATARSTVPGGAGLAVGGAEVVTGGAVTGDVAAGRRVVSGGAGAVATVAGGASSRSWARTSQPPTRTAAPRSPAAPIIPAAIASRAVRPSRRPRPTSWVCGCLRCDGLRTGGVAGTAGTAAARHRVPARRPLPPATGGRRGPPRHSGASPRRGRNRRRAGADRPATGRSARNGRRKPGSGPGRTGRCGTLATPWAEAVQAGCHGPAAGGLPGPRVNIFPLSDLPP